MAGAKITMELMDLYTPEHIPTGKTIERGGRPEADEMLLITHACIFNAGGHMLIQKRSMAKESYPGIWDVSAGGGVKSGESSLDAVIRETEEELGIELTAEDLKFYGTVPFSYVLDDFYIVQLWSLELNEIKFQKEEITEVKFASMTEILAMIESGEFVDYDPKEIQGLFTRAN